MSEQDRVDKVEKRVDSLERDVAEIKDQVTNHLPTTLQGHGKILKSLQDRQLAEDHVGQFLKNIYGRIAAGVGLLGGVLGIVWIFLLILQQVRG